MDKFLLSAARRPHEISYINISIAIKDKDIGMRAAVSVSCILSILGSLLIIISFIIQKHRTKAREILVHISFMDLGVGLANLIGALVYFDRFYETVDGASPHIDRLCKTQAFFAEYCTLTSIFWTAALAAYLYLVILHHRQPILAQIFLRACYFVCYGLALLISVWLVLTDRLGYSPYDSSGWCSLIALDPKTGETDMFVLVFAYEIWVYLAAILIVIMYLAIRGFLSNQLKISKKNHNLPESRFWSSMNYVDYKFVLIPVIFVLLRVWTFILTVLLEYAKIDEDQIPTPVLKTLLYLSGIGDSLQGFTNAILFIAFTKSVRKNFSRYIYCRCCRHGSEESLAISDDENSSIIQKVTLNNGNRQAFVTPLLYGSVGTHEPLPRSDTPINTNTS